jgi:hypothetical protein
MTNNKHQNTNKQTKQVTQTKKQTNKQTNRKQEQIRYQNATLPFEYILNNEIFLSPPLFSASNQR